jgi:hypothetical protein
MERLRYKLLSLVCGLSSGLAGLFSFAGCYGGTCRSCLRCAGAGTGVLLMLLFTRSIHKFGKHLPEPLWRKVFSRRPK